MSETQEERRTRPFADFLAEHNSGRSHARASLALQSLVEAVKQTGKKGSVSVQVMVEPMKGNDDVMLTTVTIIEKPPVEPAKAAVFYVDDEGNLTRDNPQLSFDSLKEAPAPEVKDVALPTAEVREVGRS